MRRDSMRVQSCGSLENARFRLLRSAFFTPLKALAKSGLMRQQSLCRTHELDARRTRCCQTAAALPPQPPTALVSAFGCTNGSMTREMSIYARYRTVNFTTEAYNAVAHGAEQPGTAALKSADRGTSQSKTVAEHRTSGPKAPSNQKHDKPAPEHESGKDMEQH